MLSQATPNAEKHISKMKYNCQTDFIARIHTNLMKYLFCATEILDKALK
jgi:hypothetical protein